jgi:NADP-dependent 3-hydroxy acid dehydrogenase YdfG
VTKKVVGVFFVRFRHGGWCKVVLSARSKDKLNELKKTIEDKGGEALVVMLMLPRRLIWKS